MYIILLLSDYTEYFEYSSSPYSGFIETAAASQPWSFSCNKTVNA